jgi:hypothetical protein
MFYVFHIEKFSIEIFYTDVYKYTCYLFIHMIPAGVAIPPAAKLTTGNLPVLATSLRRWYGAFMSYQKSKVILAIVTIGATTCDKMHVIRCARYVSNSLICYSYSVYLSYMYDK